MLLLPEQFSFCCRVFAIVWLWQWTSDVPVGLVLLLAVGCFGLCVVWEQPCEHSARVSWWQKGSVRSSQAAAGGNRSSVVDWILRNSFPKLLSQFTLPPTASVSPHGPHTFYWHITLWFSTFSLLRVSQFNFHLRFLSRAMALITFPCVYWLIWITFLWNVCPDLLLILLTELPLLE